MFVSSIHSNSTWGSDGSGRKDVGSPSSAVRYRHSKFDHESDAKPFTTDGVPNRQRDSRKSTSSSGLSKQPKPVLEISVGVTDEFMWYLYRLFVTETYQSPHSLTSSCDRSRRHQARLGDCNYVAWYDVRHAIFPTKKAKYLYIKKQNWHPSHIEEVTIIISHD